MVFQLLAIPEDYRTNQNPLPLVYTHCALRGLQVGTFITLVRSAINYKQFGKTFIRTLPQNTLIGAGFGIAACFGVSTMGPKSTLEHNQKRYYQLQQNKYQNTLDDFMLIGGGLGGVYAKLAGGMGLGTGICIGFTIGQIGYMAYKMSGNIQ